MTQQRIWDTALRQSAIDMGCAPEDFLRHENVIVPSRAEARARAYLTLPFPVELVSYGHNVVASVQPEYRQITEDYLGRFPGAYCFQTPNLYALDEALAPLGLRVCYMSEYFLPDLSALRAQTCDFALRLLGPAEFADLYRPEWSNALCESRRALDVLGVGAYDGGALVGLAGCSADCEDMWQIGVDVLPCYRGRGIASALTGRLTAEILGRDKVPFYCAAWSNLASVRSALRCGFRPAWTELTIRPAEEVARALGRGMSITG